ncbi:MAG: hypothetical protein KAH23_03230 [Kiritimatiellae bacterium]|nr:hypothetical protein [Kiritimatiellia bacterium]
MDFIPQKHLEDAIDGGELSRIRQALQTYLNQDRGNATCIPGKASEWTEKRVAGLFEVHDDKEEALLSDESDWSVDYWTTQKVALSYNFSAERMNHIMKVGAYLRDEKGEEDYKPSSTLLRPEKTPTKIHGDKSIKEESAGNYSRIGGVVLISVGVAIGGLSAAKQMSMLGLCIGGVVLAAGALLLCKSVCGNDRKHD